MSVEFMVLAMPRSGTAWCANWLTTDRTLCLHDPLWSHHYSELDGLRYAGRRLGVSCTGLPLFPEFLARHKARKVILHRPIAEIEASLEQLGQPALGAAWEGALDRITGLHVDWADVYKPEKAAGIYEFLLQKPMDFERHELLARLNIQMAFEQIKVNTEAAEKLFAELREAGNRGRMQ